MDNALYAESEHLDPQMRADKKTGHSEVENGKLLVHQESGNRTNIYTGLLKALFFVFLFALWFKTLT